MGRTEGKLWDIGQLLESITDRRATSWQVVTYTKDPLLRRGIVKK